MKTKNVKIGNREFKLIRYKEMWVFPVISTYEHGLGSPIAFMMYCWNGKWLAPYSDITVNLPECKREAGCQFIDINNNDSGILDWLEENIFGKRTGRSAASGFCTYPEFDFYKGEEFWEYRRICEELRNE